MKIRVALVKHNGTVMHSSLCESVDEVMTMTSRYVTEFQNDIGAGEKKIVIEQY